MLPDLKNPTLSAAAEPLTGRIRIDVLFAGQSNNLPDLPARSTLTGWRMQFLHLVNTIGPLATFSGRLLYLTRKEMGRL